MKETVIDNNVKAYLVACLVSGIHVESDPHEFMTGLVSHINSLTDRLYWANGDEDGVILHDKNDTPVLSLIYDGQTLKFMMFQTEEYLATGLQKDVGLMLLNVLAYIREEGLKCEPESSRIYRTVVSPSSQESQEDWSL